MFYLCSVVCLCLITSACASQRELAIQKDDRKLVSWLTDDDVSDVSISPNGEHIVVLSNSANETKLVFLKTADMSQVGGLHMPGIYQFWRTEWASDTRLVAQLAKQDGPLSPRMNHGEIFAVDIDGTHEKLIFGYRSGGPSTGTHISSNEGLKAWGYLLDTLASDPDNILVRSERWPEGVEPGLSEAFKVDVHTGRRTRIAVGPDKVSNYYTDEAANVRLALSTDEQSKGVAYWFDGQWKRLEKVAPLSPRARPLLFSAATKTLYALDREGKGDALFAISMETGAKTVISSHPESSPRSVLFDHVTNKPIAVEYEPNYPMWKAIDSAHPLMRILKIAFERFPGQHPRITSVTADHKQAIVFMASDQTPGTYVLVRSEDAFVKPLVRVREAQTGVPVEPIQFTSSDKLTIPGYLMMPVQKTPGPAPMIVMPHGGPHGVRTPWGYDSEAQMLAAQGYAVLQVNFRGSSGVSGEFQEAGYLKWGDRIQDDIIEATRWAIEKGYADPKRICIFGASFGGYSAMQSSIRAPGLFKCAVGYAGVYDLELMFDEGDIQKTRRGRAYLEKVIGTDEDKLRAGSPTHNADKLTVPILLVHGGADKRAPISHAEALCDAAKAAKKSCESMFVSLEGHGFGDTGNRVLAYERILGFFDEHLK